jgi:hypothetical protein
MGQKMHHPRIKSLYKLPQGMGIVHRRPPQAGIGKGNGFIAGPPQPPRQQGHPQTAHIQTVNQYHGFLLSYHLPSPEFRPDRLFHLFENGHLT